MAPSGALYVIKSTPSGYISAKKFHKFSIQFIEKGQPFGLLHKRTFRYEYGGQTHVLKVVIGDLARKAFNFNEDELNAAFDELAVLKIEKMLSVGVFEDELSITSDTLAKISSHNGGFELYKDCRKSI